MIRFSESSRFFGGLFDVLVTEVDAVENVKNSKA